MTNGIIIGIGSTVGALLIVGFVALISRQWRTPKRVDRLESVIPVFARALLALLHVHRLEENNGPIQEVEEELQRVLTDSVISQKGNK